MKNYRTVLGWMLSILIVALQAGCASAPDTTKGEQLTQVVMDTWRGQSIDEVTDAWGAPDKRMKRMNGGFTHTWVSSSGGKESALQCRQSFVTNPEGVVVSWSYIDCPKYLQK